LRAENKQQEAIMQYLLGQAPHEDQSSFEERIVTDGEFYDELLIAEDELIDQYLSSQLSESERESFENYFLLEPERQRKLRFGRAFNKLLGTVELAPDVLPVSENVTDGTLDVPKPPPKLENYMPPLRPVPARPWYAIFLPGQNPVLAYSVMAALVLIVAGISWYALRNFGPTDPGRVYVAELAPGGPTRSGGEEKKITLPLGTGTLELRLAVAGDAYRSYRGVLVGDSGSEVWQGTNLQSISNAGTGVVTVRIPVRSLAPGQYRLKLSGQTVPGEFEDLLSYYFRIQP
jgi:hypothetical protein